MKKKKILKIIFVVVSAVAMLSVVLISTFANYGHLYDGFIFNLNIVEGLVIHDWSGEYFTLPGTNPYLGNVYDADYNENYDVYELPFNHTISVQTDIGSDYVRDCYSVGSNDDPVVQVAFDYADLQLNPRDIYNRDVDISRWVDVEYATSFNGEYTAITVNSAFSFYLVNPDTLAYDLFLFTCTTDFYAEDDYYLYVDILNGYGENDLGDSVFVESSWYLYNVNDVTVNFSGHNDGGFLPSFEICIDSLDDYLIVESIVGTLDQDVNFMTNGNDISTWTITNSRLANGYPIIDDGHYYGGTLAEVEVETNFFDWLFQAVGSFLNMNVFGIPGVTYGTLIFLVMSVPIIVIFLRLFAGG